jgi:NTP pyrophosphatase (non-canonical NTP hydrolase)
LSAHLKASQRGINSNLEAVHVRTLGDVAELQISEFQEIIREKVGAQDRKMGRQFLLNVLVEEVGELSRVLRKGGENEVAKEVCDIIFTATSIANLVGVEVEPILKRKFVDPPLSDISRDWTDVTWK